MRTEFIDDISKLKLDVFVIGYSKKGESQIILVYDEDKIIYSFVIDCYSQNEINKTIDLLNSQNVSAIDYFIWTHTDEDHSIGIQDIIDQFCNKGTNFYLPEFNYGHIHDLIDYNEEVKASFHKINELNKRQNFNVNSISAPSGGFMSILDTKLQDKRGIYQTLQVLGVAPSSPLLRRRWNNQNITKKNDFSIALIFKLGDLNLLFSGDIENTTINQIPDFYFENLCYIKTPHHTSKSSDALLKKINSDEWTVSTSVSTVYKQHLLPDLDLVSEYKNISEKFYSTGSGLNNFGYIKTSFDVIEGSIIEEEVFGDATEL